MKKLLAVFLAFSCCLGALCISVAATTTASGKWGELDWVLDSNGTLTISGEGEMDDFWYELEYQIPIYVEDEYGNWVESDGGHMPIFTGNGSKEAWRAHGSKVKNVVIEEGVTSIGDWAFAYFTNMKSITIPKTVTESHVDPFQGCSALEKVYISDIAAYCKIAFSYWEQTDIYDSWPNVFYSNPFSMGADLYLNGSLVTNFVVPEGVKDITNFNGATGINSLTVSSTLENLGTFGSIKTLYFPSAEVLCTVGLTNFTNNPTIYINGKLFDGNLVVPGSVESIRDYAFSNWKHLKTVTLEEGVGGIGKEAFNGCTSLTDITFPTTLGSVGLKAFYGCTALQNVHISDLDKWCNVNFNYFTFFGIYNFERGSNPLEYAQNLLLNGELVTDVTVPNECYELCAFHGYKKLESISLPASFGIMDNAFLGCSNLYTVYVHSDYVITQIGALEITSTHLLDNAGIVLLSDDVTDIPNDFKAKYPYVSSATVDDTHYTVYSKYSCGIDHVAGNTWYYADGVHYHKCSVCGRDMKKEEHSFDTTGNTCTICGFTYTEGDVNGDGYVDNTDASLILKYDAGIIDLTDKQLEFADVNGDGYVDNTDASLILKFDAGIIESL